MILCQALLHNGITTDIPFANYEAAHIFRELVDKQEEPKRRFFTCESFITIGDVKRVISIEEEN